MTIDLEVCFEVRLKVSLNKQGINILVKISLQYSGTQNKQVFGKFNHKKYDTSV